MSAARRLEPDTAPAAQCLKQPGWRAFVRADALQLSLHGDWSVRNEGSHARIPEELLEHPDVRTIAFDASDPRRPAAPTAPMGLVERVGEWALARWSDGAALATLAREAVLRAVPALRGKARDRAGDILNLVYATSAAAPPIVALVNVLVGAIVGFVGGIQWRRSGVEVCEQLDRPDGGTRDGAFDHRDGDVRAHRSAYATEISAMQANESRRQVATNGDDLHRVLKKAEAAAGRVRSSNRWTT